MTVGRIEIRKLTATPTRLCFCIKRKRVQKGIPYTTAFNFQPALSVILHSMQQPELQKCTSCTTPHRVAKFRQLRKHAWRTRFAKVAMSDPELQVFVCVAFEVAALQTQELHMDGEFGPEASKSARTCKSRWQYRASQRTTVEQEMQCKPLCKRNEMGCISTMQAEQCYEAAAQSCAKKNQHNTNRAVQRGYLFCLQRSPLWCLRNYFQARLYLSCQSP